MYHIIAIPASEDEKRLACPPAAFKAQMNYLNKNGYHVISLQDAVDALKQKQSLPDKTIVITFDDGYIETYEKAYPTLIKYGFPATIFMVSSFVGKTDEWMTGKRSAPRKLCNDSQLIEMNKNGITIGSHSRSHARLSQIPFKKAQSEITISKIEIEKLIGTTVDFFAYPYGLFNSEIHEFIKTSSYSCACSTRSGFNNPSTNLFELRRIDVYGTDSLWKFKQKLFFGINDTSIFFYLKYYWTRLLSKLQNYIS